MPNDHSVAGSMPEWLDKRHEWLSENALKCYAGRDHAGYDELAEDFQEVGDRFLSDALAIGEEWED